MPLLPRSLQGRRKASLYRQHHAQCTWDSHAPLRSCFGSAHKPATSANFTKNDRHRQTENMSRKTPSQDDLIQVVRKPKTVTWITTTDLFDL